MSEFKLAEALEEHEKKLQFPPITTQHLKDILGKTIKHDDANKVITFLGMLSAFTEDSQLNQSYNAPSSTGKSYIPTEIASLFPPEDVILVGYCSPTAFFHDKGSYNKEKGGYIVNLERKIMIFLDQPHTLLLQHFRPILSHDKKEIQLKITDKTKRSGLRTMNIFVRGFPAVVFCTAWLKIDEQEATRFFLLSPNVTKDKIQAGIREKIRRECHKTKFNNDLLADQKRQQLMERIRAIKEEGIIEIIIKNTEKLEKLFFDKVKTFKSRHQRDIGYVIALVKVLALLNLWHRERDETVIYANDADIDEAFKIWEGIYTSQEYGLPPYIYDIFTEVIVPAYEDNKKAPISRKDIVKKHYQVYGRLIPDWLLRKEIFPALENVGLITQEQDPDDKRRLLISPVDITIENKEENNGGTHGGESAEKHGQDPHPPMQSTIFPDNSDEKNIVEQTGGEMPNGNDLSNAEVIGWSTES